MEAILELLSESYRIDESALVSCRKRLLVLTDRGVITEAELEDILEGIAEDLNNQKTRLLSRFSSEVQRFSSLLSSVVSGE